MSDVLENLEFVRHVVRESVVPLGLRARVRRRSSGRKEMWTVFWPLVGASTSGVPVWEICATPVGIDCLCRTAAGVNRWTANAPLQKRSVAGALRRQLWGAFCEWLDATAPGTRLPEAGHLERAAAGALSPALSASASDVMQTIAQWDMEDRGKPEQVLVETVSRSLVSASVPCHLVDRGGGHWNIVAQRDGGRGSEIVASLALNGYTACWRWKRGHGSVYWRWDKVRWASLPDAGRSREDARRRARWEAGKIAAAGGLAGGVLAGMASMLADRGALVPTVVLITGWLWACAWVVIWGSGDFPFF